ncbi:putative bifunctional diguanylate cyclase/phosphodiesterase [Methylobacterium sp. WSM2598]|nr:EAL domain-containing protein [Methylobacterium sp. WSM2598]
MNVRTKLLVSLLAMAALCGGCGAVGLLFLGRVDASVSRFSEVATPLLAESTALVEEVQRMSGVFLAEIGHGRREPDGSPILRAMGEDAGRRLGRIGSLGREWLEPELIARGTRNAQDFTRLSLDLIAAHRRREEVLAATEARAREALAQQQQIDAKLVRMAALAEIAMARSEDEAKVEAQTGRATVESLGERFTATMTGTFPTLQTVYRLVRLSSEIRNAAATALAQTDPERLAAERRRIESGLRGAGVSLRQLAGRVRVLGQEEAELAALSQTFVALEASLLREDGALASHGWRLALDAGLADGRGRLEALERDFYGLIARIDRAVRSRNEAARTEAGASVHRAKLIILALTGFAVLASTVLALRLAAAVTGPLARLTQGVLDVRPESMDVAVDPALGARADEFGILARSFDTMLREVRQARQQLLAASEAEIRLQFERLDAAVANMSQGLCMFDPDGRLIIANERYRAMYGHAPDEVRPGTSLTALLTARIARGCQLKAGQLDAAEWLAAHRTGQAHVRIDELADGRAIAVSLQPLPDGGCVVTHEDITERRRAEERIAFLAYHDVLTGLPNRARFTAALVAALDGRGAQAAIAVLYLDLDHFKAVNDTLGHPVGDALLQAVAGRIQSCLRPQDLVARLGGDEFAIVQVGPDQPAGASDLAGRLIAEVGRPYALMGHHVVVGTSVGIALAPADGTAPDRLMKCADMALYRAKGDGRGAYRFFEPAMGAQMEERRALEIDLRQAVRERAFHLHYQPLLNLRTNRVSGFEALLRWTHPHRGPVPPDGFVPLLEELGLIREVGAWVLETACRDAAGWPTDVKVAVNLSALQFRERAVVRDAAAALEASGLPPGRLELEITETVLLQDTDETLATLHALRESGLRISMDDFGTGYSSLSYLRRFPFDKIKIDRFFVQDLETKADSAAIVRAVTGLSHALGMTTAAEGVETHRQLEKLRAEGCTEVQGFLISRPRPAAEVGAMLEQAGAIFVPRAA